MYVSDILRNSCTGDLVIVPEQYLVLFRTGTRSIRSGPGTFFVLEPNHANLFCEVFTV